MSSDSLTVLTSVNRKLASKTFSQGKDGRIKNRSYGNEKHFSVASVEVAGIVELARALEQISRNRHAFIVRGEPLPGIDRKRARRLLHPDRKTGEPATLAEVPRHWFLVDGDEIPCPAAIDPKSDPEGAVEHVIGLLPRECWDATCWWQFSSSQSVVADDNLSLHLCFWSEIPLDDAALTRWALAANAAGRKLIDPALFRAAQPHYLALPDFVAPLVDPLPRRCGLRQGLDDSVSLIIPPPHPKRPAEPSAEGYEPGRGVHAYLDMIGGAAGFRGPIVKAVASYIAIWGSKSDCAALKAEIRKAIDRADPGGRSADTLDRYKSDEHLGDIIEAIRRFQGDTPGCGFTLPDPPPHLDEPPPADPAPAPPIVRPVVRVIAGGLPAVIDAAEEILIERDRDLYEFADQIVRPALAPIKIADKKETTGLRLVPVRLHHMIERFTRSVDFQKYSRARKQWEATDCPEAVAKAYLERVGAWRLPRLTMITCCPMLLADGRILDRPGFDEASGILFDPQGATFPPVPPRPTQADARRALDLLTAPFGEFPFVDGMAKSVMWSALLSSVARPAFDFVPLHGFDAPVAGTGKSKLVDCCSILVKGHECPVISQGDDETEFEKRLGAELIEGNRMISIDNCERPLGGALLCQTATQPLLKVRLLGFSKTVTVTNGASMFATGNNLKLFGDMLRRGLVGGLDAGVERPELRTFKREDPVSLLKRERGRHVAAALTVLHAYNIADRPTSPQPLGGFEGWSALVRGALLWLGEADPVDTIEKARTDDPDRQKLEAVVRQWQAVLTNRSLTARAVIEEASWFDPAPTSTNLNRITYRHPEFRNALLDVAGERGRVSAGRLGKWLGRNKHKVVGKHRLAADTLLLGNARWKLQQLVNGHWE